MHVFLLLLSISTPFLLASPTSPNVRPPSLPEYERYMVHCFTSWSGHRLVHPDPRDCTAALRLVLCGDKTSAPMHFSRNSGFTVPHRWAHGTCSIILDIAGDDNEGQFDIFSLEHVADRGIELFGRCVNNEKHGVGGKTTVGPKNEFLLLMIGTEEETYRPQKYPPTCWLNPH